MASTTRPRKTFSSGDFSPAPGPMAIPLEASAKLFTGTIAARNAAFNLVDVTAATGLFALGVIDGPGPDNADQAIGGVIDNTGGAAGAKSATVKPGVYFFANSTGADAIPANYQGVCYMADNQTAALTDGGGTRSVMGTVMGVAGADTQIAGQVAVLISPETSAHYATLA